MQLLGTYMTLNTGNSTLNMLTIHVEEKKKKTFSTFNSFNEFV